MRHNVGLEFILYTLYMYIHGYLCLYTFISVKNRWYMAINTIIFSTLLVILKSIYNINTFVFEFIYFFAKKKNNL